MKKNNILSGILSRGIDHITEVNYKCDNRFYVFNYTHPYFSVGVTTSGGFGLWLSGKAAKRGGVEQHSHTAFDGILAQIGFWWFKVYLYLYFNGDGLK